MGRPARPGLCACAVLVGIPGCAQLAGIDETTGLVPPELVSLQVDRLSVGATVMRTPLDLSANTASYLVPDDTVTEGFLRVPAELTDVNLWTGPVPDGTPPVQFDLPDAGTPLQRIWQFPNRNLTAMFGIYEHLAPEPAPPGAMLTVDATLPAAVVAGETFQFVSIGTWNARVFSGMLEAPAVGALALGPISFAFDTTSKLPGRSHEKITTADAVLVLRHDAGRLTGVMEAAPFEQTGTDTIMGTMTAVAADQTLTADHRPSLVAGRFMPLRPAMGAPSMSWTLIAAPGVDHGASRGVTLHSASVLAADPPLAIPFGNPFVAKGWRTVFLFATAASRTVTPPGQALPVTLRAELYTYTEPTPDMIMTLPAGLPELITIDGLPLSSDGLTIPRPVQQVTVSFVAGGTNSLYQVQLFELVPNAAGTALEYKHVIEALGPSSELTLPPEVFVPGKYYTIRGFSYSGSFPNFADGDLGTRTFPLSVAHHDSGVFSVMP